MGGTHDVVFTATDALERTTQRKALEDEMDELYTKENNRNNGQPRPNKLYHTMHPRGLDRLQIWSKMCYVVSMCTHMCEITKCTRISLGNQTNLFSK